MSDLSRSLVLDPRVYVGGGVAPPATLEDRSRYGNNGTFSGSMAWVKNASGIWYLKRDTAQSVNIPTSASLTSGLVKQNSFVVWTKRSGGSIGNSAWAGLITQNTGNWLLQWDYNITAGGCDIGFSFIEVGGASKYLATNTMYPQGTWYFIVGTWDGQYSKIYVNCVLSKTSADWSAFTPRSTASITYILGSLNRGGDNSVGYFRVYNRVLTLDEQSRLYTRTKGWFI